MPNPVGSPRTPPATPPATPPSSSGTHNDLGDTPPGATAPKANRPAIKAYSKADSDRITTSTAKKPEPVKPASAGHEDSQPISQVVKDHIQNADDHLNIEKTKRPSVNGLAEDRQNLLNDRNSGELDHASADDWLTRLETRMSALGGYDGKQTFSQTVQNHLTNVDSHTTMNSPSSQGLATDINLIKQDVQDGTLSEERGNIALGKLNSAKKVADNSEAILSQVHQLPTSTQAAFINAGNHLQMADPSREGLIADAQALQGLQTNGQVSSELASSLLVPLNNKIRTLGGFGDVSKALPEQYRNLPTNIQNNLISVNSHLNSNSGKADLINDFNNIKSAIRNNPDFFGAGTQYLALLSQRITALGGFGPTP